MYTYYIADAYGTSTYNNATYNSTGTSSKPNQLANTGVNVMGIGASAFMLIVAAVLVITWRKKPSV